MFNSLFEDHNFEIVELKNMNDVMLPLIEDSEFDLRQHYTDKPFRMFEYRFIKFQWDFEEQQFNPIKFECEVSFDSLRAKYTDPNNTYSEKKREFNRVLFGKCEVDVPKKSIITLLFDEVLNPFYIFQVFSVILWMWDGYRLYASCILIVSTLSVVASLHETVSNNNSIRTMAAYSCTIDLLKKDRTLKTVNSAELLPGDVIELP